MHYVWQWEYFFKKILKKVGSISDISDIKSAFPIDAYLSPFNVTLPREDKEYKFLQVKNEGIYRDRKRTD